VAKRQRLVLLKLQPPVGASAVGARLEDLGFIASGLGTAPLATVRLDLRQPPEALLAAMRPSLRSNIGKARRKGVTVRTGTSADLVRFVALVEDTGRRQGFSPYPARYYRALWDSFSANGRAVLLLAEREGRPLSAVLLIAWGGIVTYKMGGWSGEREGVHPNELLHWTGIEWARRAGCRWYDLDGINEEVGRAMIEGRDPGAAARQGVTHFKLGFGGEVVVSPGAYDYSPRPIVAAAVRRAGSMAEQRSWLVSRLLGRGH
jgi:lipid II:glycine glycyltransferase (peptidoglycan interpeptide bridge formation enzyme)